MLVRIMFRIAMVIVLFIFIPSFFIGFILWWDFLYGLFRPSKELKKANKCTECRIRDCNDALDDGTNFICEHKRLEE